MLYTLFAMAGAYPLEELQTLRKWQPIRRAPVPKFVYAEAATGQGISVAAGLALIAKRENFAKSLYLPAMANWQKARPANFAGYHRLDNLIVILDINRLAQSGETMFGSDAGAYAKRLKPSVLKQHN